MAPLRRAALAAALLALAACGDDTISTTGTATEATTATTTSSSDATAGPTTDESTSEASSGSESGTTAGTTDGPTTDAPTTDPSTTDEPTTDPSTTDEPTTDPSTTTDPDPTTGGDPPPPPDGLMGCNVCDCCDPWPISWSPVPEANHYIVRWKCSINPEQVHDVGDVTSIADVCNDIEMCNGMCVFTVGYIKVEACIDDLCSNPVNLPGIPISCGGGCCC